LDEFEKMDLIKFQGKERWM